MSENKTITDKDVLDAIKNVLRKSGDLSKIQAETTEAKISGSVGSGRHNFNDTVDMLNGDGIKSMRECMILKEARKLWQIQIDEMEWKPVIAAYISGLRMRAKVTEILQDRQFTNNPGCRNFSPPAPTAEVLLINDLIKEYLEWNGYLYTSTVLTSEAALPKEKRTRAELCVEVGVKDDEKSSALPLLTNIVAAYTERIKRKISKIKKDCA